MDRTREDRIEEKLTATAEGVGQAAASAAQRVSDTLERGRAALADAQAAITEKSRDYMRTTDSYVRDNPWQAVGIAAGVGLLIGFIIAKR